MRVSTDREWLRRQTRSRLTRKKDKLRPRKSAPENVEGLPGESKIETTKTETEAAESGAESGELFSGVKGDHGYSWAALKSSHECTESMRARFLSFTTALSGGDVIARMLWALLNRATSNYYSKQPVNMWRDLNEPALDAATTVPFSGFQSSTKPAWPICSSSSREPSLHSKHRGERKKLPSHTPGVRLREH